MKKLLLSFLLLSTFAYAGIDNDHPYMMAGTNGDKSVSIYIGAYGNFAPFMNKHQVTIIHEMVRINTPGNGFAAGAQSEIIIAADCEKQVEKEIVVATRAGEASDANALFTDEESVVNALVALPYQPIKPDTIAAHIIDMGCNYVSAPRPKQEKPKAPEIEI